MNARERLFAKLDGKETDRLPNLNIVMQFAAKEIGATYEQFCTDYKTLAQGNIAVATRYGLDIVTTMSDPMREAHDYGTDVVFPLDDVPYPRVELLKDKAALGNLKVIAPENGRRMSQTVQTIEYYKKEVGTDFPIAGWVEGMFAEAADLRGVNDFMIDLFDDEGFCKELFELLFEQAVLYARAQVDAGADIIGVGDAISSVAGPNMYALYGAQYQRRLLGEIRAMGAKTKLHICGNTQPLLPLIPFDVIDIFDVDWMVPLKEAAEASGGRSCISGNYDPVAVLLQGTPETVAQAVKKAAKQGGARYISAAGCEVPKFTPPENLLAVAQTLKEL